MIVWGMARPRNAEQTVLVEVGFTPKAIKYLDLLKEKDGFGSSRSEVIRNLVWKEIHRLIEVKRLDEFD